MSTQRTSANSPLYNTHSSSLVGWPNNYQQQDNLVKNYFLNMLKQNQTLQDEINQLKVQVSLYGQIYTSLIATHTQQIEALQKEHKSLINLFKSHTHPTLAQPPGKPASTIPLNGRSNQTRRLKRLREQEKPTRNVTPKHNAKSHPTTVIAPSNNRPLPKTTNPAPHYLVAKAPNNT